MVLPIDELRQDLRYALRALWRSPGFAVVAILTLTLGIGANTAIFSVVNAVVLRPIPYRDPASLVLIDIRSTLSAPSAPSWLTSAWRERARTFSDFAGFNGPSSATLVVSGEPEQVQSAFITWNFLSLLGVVPTAGRDFAEADASPGAPSVALLSHALWITRFGGDSSIVGRTVRISGSAVTVVGVTPPTFRFPATDAVGPTSLSLDTQPDVMRVAGPATRLTVIGRLAPGIPVSAAARELLAIYKQAAASLLDDGKREYSQSEIDRLQLEAGPLQERLAGNVRKRLWLAMGAVGFVLLVACANVANLLLARASTRHRELAVRTALGAGRGRLVQLLLTESVLLALIGSALGLVLAVSTSGVARMVLAERLPHIDTIAIDWWVLGFTVAVAAVTGMLCGLSSIPAATRVSLAGVFSGSAPSVTGRSAMRLVLLSAEVAVTFVLVVGAALLVQTLWNLSTKDRGFEADRLLTVRVSPGAPRDLDRSDRRAPSRYFAAFFSDLRARLERIPGVVSAGAVSRAPLAGTASRLANIAVEGRGHPADESSAPIAFVTPGYFRTMRIPMIAGRDFDERDRLGAERVLIVNEAFQRRFAPDGSIVGARVTSLSESFTVIGLTEDVPDRSLREAPEPLVMAPLAQMPAGNITWVALTFVLRTAGGDPLRLAPPVRKEIWAINPDIVISEVATMDERVARTIRAERDSALLFGLFAVAALVMAAIGVYGVAAFAIVQRTREIGIRIALGAAPRDVSRLVVSQTLVPTMIGIALGIAGAAIATKLVVSMVYGVTPLDPATFAAAVFVLISVALAATWLPSRRATCTDPLIALRSQ
jgi:putative ABC transport system permease protein